MPFVITSGLSLISSFLFLSMEDQAGAELSGRQTTAIAPAAEAAEAD
jgi:hypothetical protein